MTSSQAEMQIMFHDPTMPIHKGNESLANGQ